MRIMLFCSLRCPLEHGSKINKKEVVDAVTDLKTRPVVDFGIVGYIDTPRGQGQFKRTFDSLNSLFSPFVSSVFSLIHENIALFSRRCPLAHVSKMNKKEVVDAVTLQYSSLFLILYLLFFCLKLEIRNSLF